MWFDILKDSKQVSRTMGSIDWEKETIPDTEDDNCKRDLLKILERAKLVVKNKSTVEELGFEVSIIGWLGVDMAEKIKEIPEEVICELLKQFKNLEGEGSFNITDRPDGFILRGMKTTNTRPLWGETLLYIGQQNSKNVHFGITIIWSKRKYTRLAIEEARKLYGNITKTKEYKAKKVKFDLLSKKIFGEYY
jgi:hypothetical protein